jgi:hypothetical protein
MTGTRSDSHVFTNCYEVEDTRCLRIACNIMPLYIDWQADSGSCYSCDHRMTVRMNGEPELLLGGMRASSGDLRRNKTHMMTFFGGVYSEGRICHPACVV